MYARKPKNNNNNKRSMDSTCVAGATIVAGGTAAVAVSAALIADVVASDLEEAGKSIGTIDSVPEMKESVLLESAKDETSDEVTKDNGSKGASTMDPKVARDLKITGAVFLGAAGIGLAAWKIHRLTNQKAQIDGIEAETDVCRNIIDSISLEANKTELKLFKLTERSEQSELNIVQELITHVSDKLADFNQRNPTYHDDTFSLGLKLNDMQTALNALKKPAPRLSA